MGGPQAPPSGRQQAGATEDPQPARGGREGAEGAEEGRKEGAREGTGGTAADRRGGEEGTAAGEGEGTVAGGEYPSLLRRSPTTSRRSRAEANARGKCRTCKDKQFCTRNCKTMSQTGNLRYLTEDQHMLERLVETADKEMCRDATASPRRHGRRPERGPYSPNVGGGTLQHHLGCS